MVPHPEQVAQLRLTVEEVHLWGAKPALGLTRRRTGSRRCRALSPASALQLQQSSSVPVPLWPTLDAALWPGWLLWKENPRELMWVLLIGPLLSFDDISFGLGRGILSFKLTNLPNSSWAWVWAQPLANPFLGYPYANLIISPQIFLG